MFTWFLNNGMKDDPVKCHLFISKKENSTTVTSDNFKIHTNDVETESILEYL